MAKKKTIPPRSAVKVQDTWDLTKIFKSDAAWEKGYKKLERMVPTFETFRGKLGRSAKGILSCLEFEAEFQKLAEQLGVYAFLKSTEDVADSTYQGMVARYMHLATIAGEAASFIAPEMQAIPKKKMAAFMKSPLLAGIPLLPAETGALPAPYPLGKGGAPPRHAGGSRWFRLHHLRATQRCRHDVRHGEGRDRHRSGTDPKLLPQPVGVPQARGTQGSLHQVLQGI